MRADNGVVPKQVSYLATDLRVPVHFCFTTATSRTDGVRNRRGVFMWQADGN